MSTMNNVDDKPGDEVFEHEDGDEERGIGIGLRKRMSLVSRDRWRRGLCESSVSPSQVPN